MIKYPNKIPLFDKAGLVYHYTSHTTVLEHIFYNGQIEFGRMHNTNDPYERKVWSIDINRVEWTSTDDDIDKEIKAYHMLNTIHSKCHLFCTTLDSYRNSDEYLGRGFSIPSLWAHYSANHKGVCLIFNQSKLTEAVLNTAEKINIPYFCEKMEYGNPPDIDHPAFNNLITMNEDSIDNIVVKHIIHHYKTLFFTKDKTWDHENEFRFVVIVRDNEPFKIDISGALEGIVLGEYFPESYLPLIENAKNKYQCDSFRIEWQNGLPQVYPYP